MAISTPNILFIMTDQHRADHLGCYGNKILKTPNMNSIAANGVTFDRFYVANSTCMPNRATLITGRMPSNNGVLSNGQPLPIDSNTFVHILRQGRLQNCALWQEPPAKWLPPWGGDWNYPAYPDGVVPPEGFRDSNLSLRQGQNMTTNGLTSGCLIRHARLQHHTMVFEEVRFANAHGDGVRGHYTAWARSQHPDFDSLIGPKNAEPAEHIVNPIAWKTRVPEELSIPQLLWSK